MVLSDPCDEVAEKKRVNNNYRAAMSRLGKSLRQASPPVGNVQWTPTQIEGASHLLALLASLSAASGPLQQQSQQKLSREEVKELFRIDPSSAAAQAKYGCDTQRIFSQSAGWAEYDGPRGASTACAGDAAMQATAAAVDSSICFIRTVEYNRRDKEGEPKVSVAAAPLQVAADPEAEPEAELKAAAEYVASASAAASGHTSEPAAVALLPSTGSSVWDEFL